MKSFLIAGFVATAVLVASVANPLAQQRRQPEAHQEAAEGLNVRYVRWKLDSKDIAMVWFQIGNQTSSDWRIQVIGCDIYDDRGNFLGRQKFKLSLVVFGNVPFRETEGFDNVSMPRNAKPRCWVERAVMCHTKEC